MTRAGQRASKGAAAQPPPPHHPQSRRSRPQTTTQARQTPRLKSVQRRILKSVQPRILKSVLHRMHARPACWRMQACETLVSASEHAALKSGRCNGIKDHHPRAPSVSYYQTRALLANIAAPILKSARP
eukprot:898896-Pleurochrysis_carterae.AAC.1